MTSTPQAYMVDGDSGNARQAERFFKEKDWPADAYRPRFDNIFVRRGSINQKILAAGPVFHGGIDLFSLDLDGVDYWVLEAVLTGGQIEPRVRVT